MQTRCVQRTGVPPGAGVSCAAAARRTGSRRLRSTNPACRSQKESNGGPSETLRSLDSLVPPPAAPPPPSPAAAGVRRAGPDEQPPAADGERREEEPFAWYDRPATPPKGPLRTKGMQAGTSGDYLDSEVFTRDPLQLRVGARTALADGTPPLLPEAPPLASRALAVAVAGVGLATLASAGWEAPLELELELDSLELALGASWQLLTASLAPVGWLDAAAAVASLASAGAYAEHRLGAALLTAAFFLPGAAAWLLYFVFALGLPFPTQYCGPWVPLGGCAAALAAFGARNWRVLGLARQRGACLAAVAGLAAVSLATPDYFDPPVAVLAALVGGGLGWAAGPDLEVVRELDIPDGSMTISGEEAELEVVVDRRTAPARWLAIGGAAALLGGAAWGVLHPFWELREAVEQLDEEELTRLMLALDRQLRALVELDPDPEAQQLLFDLDPERWSRKA